MFLDSFAENASKSNIDLVDLELECAVSLEAAYNDAMLEVCQLKYQSLVEGVSVINEGVIEIIKNFFKRLFNAIKKFFGFRSNNGGEGSASPSNIEKLKKSIRENHNHIIKGIKYIADHPELSKKYKFINEKSIINAASMVKSKALKDAIENSLVELKDLEEKFKRDGQVKVDADAIALDSLRIFLQSAAGDKIDVDKIESIDDFRNALSSKIKYESLEEHFESLKIDDSRDIDSILENQLQVLLEASMHALQYKITIENKLKLYQNQIITDTTKMFPKYENVACKVANILAQACMVCATFTNKVCNKVYQDHFRLVNEARAVYNDMMLETWQLKIQ